MKLSRSNQGFTLLEICIALSISSLCALIGFNIISSGAASTELIETRANQLKNLIYFKNVLQKDLDQIYYPFSEGKFRIANDAGNPIALKGTASAITLTTNSIAFKERGSISLPNVVSYRFSETEGENVLSRTENILFENSSQLASPLTGIIDFSIKYYDENLEQHANWPPVNDATNNTAHPLRHYNPRLITIEVKHELFKKISISSSSY